MAKDKNTVRGNGFDADPSRAAKAGAKSKRGPSAKSVVQKYISNNPDKIEKIIEACITRAEKGDVEMQTFLLQQGAWLKEEADVSVSIQNPTFIVNAPDGMDDKDT